MMEVLSRRSLAELIASPELNLYGAERRRRAATEVADEMRERDLRIESVDVGLPSGGTTAFTFTVSLSEPSATQVKVQFSTENVTATYRIGIGESGNVDAGQITMLASKPLGVKEVVNPMRASGGASGDTDEQARRNTPIALLALDRLVSVRDYADFARAFAGIGKAAAEQFNVADGEIVHLAFALDCCDRDAITFVATPYATTGVEIRRRPLEPQ